MKITRNTTVQQLKDFLNANHKTVAKKDKALAESITYAGNQIKKDPKLVKKADLADLAKQVISLLGDAVVEATTPAPKLTPVAENSVKPTPKGKLTAGKGKAKAEPKKQDVPATPAKKEDTPKSAPAKQAEPKAEPPKKGGKTLKSTVEMVTADFFPEELEVNGAKYTLTHGIKTLKELYEVAVKQEKDVVFAYVWTKRHLKQYAYFGDWLGHPSEPFENDLDLTTTVHVLEDGAVAYQISMYTEAIYTILPADLEEIDGVRCAGGIEYQIYVEQK